MRRTNSLTRRELLEAATLAAGSAVFAATPLCAATAARKSSVVVAADGSGDFGPQTRGTHTSGIQEAIEAVRAQGGGVVHLRAGVYPVDSTLPPPEEAREQLGTGPATLRVYDDITLRGEGMDRTIIRIAANCNTNTILAWAASRVAIEDLTVHGAGLNAGYGIAIFGMGVSFADVYLCRVKATGFGGSAIAVCGGQRAIVEQCVGAASEIGFEMGSPSVDYLVLHCTAYGCDNGTLGFNPADQYNEAGNLRPRVIGGLYDGEGKASGVVLADCLNPIIQGVVARRGVTTNIQISSSNRKTITTSVGGGLIESCVAEGSVGSAAGKYGIGARQEGVQVIGCTVAGNEDVGVLAAPGDGGNVSVHDCTFRAGQGGVQRYAILPQGRGVALRAHRNLYDGGGQGFIASLETLAVPGSRLADNLHFNPVGLLPAPDVPDSGEFLPNVHPYTAQVHIHSGRVQAVFKRDLSGRTARVGSSSNLAVALQPGEAIAAEYTQRPQWSWFGL